MSGSVHPGTGPGPATCPFAHAGSSNDMAGFDPHYSDDLYAALAAARTQAPVFYAERIGHWVVTKYRDVLAVLRDTARYSAQNATTRLTPMHEGALQILRDGNFTPETTQASIDPPRHTRIRDATNPLMNVRVAALMEAEIRRIVREHIAPLRDLARAGTPVDLLRAFAYELPARVIFLLLGVPDADTPRVKELATGRTQIDFSPSTPEQQIVGAHNLVGLWQYTIDLVQDRLRTPRNDFTSGLLRIRDGDDAVLTLNEVNTIVYGIFFAGHETTTNQLTNAFRELLGARHNWEALCAEPQLIPNAVEEAFRHCGAVVGWRRRTKEAVEIRGIPIPANSDVLLSFASANRDEEVFEDPERFDVRRHNARKQLTLGNGIHFCLGAPLARLEMRIVLEEFTRAFPQARLVEGRRPEHYHTFVFRAPDALWVDLGQPVPCQVPSQPEGTDRAAVPA